MGTSGPHLILAGTFNVAKIKLNSDPQETISLLHAVKQLSDIDILQSLLYLHKIQ